MTKEAKAAEGEIMETYEIFHKFSDEANKLPKGAFMALLGTMIDSYGNVHGFESKETCEMLDDLAKIQKEIHASCGKF